jgi:hypothetical protein
MQTPVAANLPGGFWSDGICYRDAEIRPLDGHDESFLLEAVHCMAPVHLASAVLSRCVSRLGSFSPVTLEQIRDLAIGDRDALLLQIRRVTLGERMQCVLQCPAPKCGEKMDLELKISDLLVPAYAQGRMEYESVLSREGAEYRVRFRLPTGRDLEAAVAPVHTSMEAAEDLVLRRCVTEIWSEQELSGEKSDLSHTPLPPAVRQALSRLMEKLDPQAELTLTLNCPSCHFDFQVGFDPVGYLLRELMEGKDLFYRQVHLLGFHYHWSESDILGMTASRRKLYLGLLAEELRARRAN